MTVPHPLPVLDRIPSPPSESARYPMLAPQAVTERRVQWALTGDFPLDQGAEGACVGFGTSAELSALPIALPTGNPFAFRLYELARAEDRKMGNEFPAGATVLAGLRAAKALGLIQGYRWATRATDIREAVLTHGSVIMGTDWRADMDRWDRHGLVSATGPVRGGHCWTIIGYIPFHPALDGRAVFEAVNSWGPAWGVNGRFLITPADVASLFEARGEAAIVTDTPQAPTPPARRWPRIPAWFRRWLAEHGIVE